MKLLECLSQLPDEMVLINHAAIPSNRKTVAEWKQLIQDEEGYQIISSLHNYGRSERVRIVHKQSGLALFTQSEG